MRTAPNELSFNTAQSWRDIYDFCQGHLTFVKSDFYDGGSFAGRCGSIVSERDTQIHGTMRKYLSHAFSQRSLTEQEALISKNIDSFISRIGEDSPHGIDIVMAFTLMSFDVIGDLGFGETFKGIKSSRSSTDRVWIDANGLESGRGSPSLDCSYDRCYDARCRGRLLQTFPNGSQTPLDIFRRSHQTHYRRHQNQWNVRD